ncbi:sporulation membrane protein YtaF [Serpentinicella sp. ANB-PHB4]|uniref:sporulation membrane protein YtaF n=1 Tax=Serpentinicella sp. ANB-PHB4 TaxID=3074076 RepID=UPI002864D19A|nr:sporulation membrane protein YtaF [Serpentinicella sp. ANB-PHB4]MDR5659466.1 sporulation membrane protein YtaF [Serpentinicella sp. ANB-PHB4]
MIEGILIAIAISIDSLSVGVAYGVKKIKVPILSLIILDFLSVSFLALGFFAGNMLLKFVPEIWTQIIGACILFTMGSYLLIQGWLNYKYPPHKVSQSTPIAMISIDSLGIGINVLRDPSRADLDISGIIDTKEAVFLGIALAIDSLAVGVAVALTSLPIIIFTLTLVGIINIIFLLSGIHLGKKFIADKFKEKTAFIPGCILILLAIIRLM